MISIRCFGVQPLAFQLPDTVVQPLSDTFRTRVLRRRRYAMAAVAEEKIAVGDAPYEPPASPPIIVFMNSASGGRMGPKVLERIRTLIPNSR